MATIDTIAQAWREFERSCLIDGQPEATRAAMRQVFYAGFSSAVGMVIRATAKNISDAEGAQMLNTLLDEMTAFSMQLAARKS